MKYLVTGGGGFIGSHIVEHLVRQGEDVRVLDDFSAGRRDNLRDLPVEIVAADIRDSESVRAAVDGVDTVFHQAALCSAAGSIRNPVWTHEVNTTGTVILLDACREAGVRRFLFASSSAVYGQTEGVPVCEDVEPAPVSPYALSKLQGEQYCRLYHEVYGLETVCLRYFNVFGPRQDPESEYAAVIPRFIEASLNGGVPTIYGTGMQTRDFTYVANVARANIDAAMSEYTVGRVFNVACGERRSLLDLVANLEDIVNHSLVPVFSDPRPGDIEHSCASIERARSMFGFAPVIPFDEGLRQTVGWFMKEYEPSQTVSRICA